MTAKHPKSDDTDASATVQDNVHAIPDRISYDLDAIQAFLTLVFHAPVLDDECVLTWSTSARPGYPVPLKKLLDTLGRVSMPRALYYGTSTCVPTEARELRNRIDLFKRLHVVVLDDIGTKVDLNTLPEALREATYVIETSPGNYQYGYVLEQPIDDIDQARALVQLMYDSGYTDAGGALPTKLVRIPGGVNAKPGPNRLFETRLVHATGARWAPEDLLRAARVDVVWADVVDDATKALRRAGARSVTPWSPIALESPNLDGGVDAVLEWLYAEKYVIQETNDWATVLCPWSHTHTTGDETAGYSPLGRGSGEHASMRGFHCFHEHCKERNATDFLAWVAGVDGPQVPVYDASVELMRSWAYDPVDDCAWRILGTKQFDAPVKLPALRNLYPRKARVPDRDGKVKLVSEVDLWVRSPHRIVIDGAMFDPTTTAPLTVHRQTTRVNTFTRPHWGEGPVYEDDVEMFTNFLTYLIPTRKEREFFLDWLAAKVQNLAFRGPAVLMIAPVQGTGRGTLADIIASLIGRQNVTNVPFDKLVGQNNFNSWQTSPLVVTDETLDLGETRFYRAYERLKGLIEFHPTEVLINEKHRTARLLPVYTSYLLFSNHTAALSTSRDDRRVYVISNTPVPAPPVYFDELYAWKDEIDEKTGAPAWTPSVGRWLLAHKINRSRLMAPAEMTAGKKAMLDETRSPIDTALELIVEEWSGDYISFTPVYEVITHLATRLGLDSTNQLSKIVQHAMNRVSTALHRNCRVRINGKQLRPRILRRAMTAEKFSSLCTSWTGNTHEVQAIIESNDVDAIRIAVLAKMDLREL